MQSEPLLRVVDLRRSFGGVHAVTQATFDVPRGSITGLIGPNGAGKSTTFDLIAGRTSSDGGRVNFDGADISNLQPDAIAARGLVRTFQIPRTFTKMTVWENLLFSADRQPGEGFWQGLLGSRAVRRREAEIAAKADEVLAFIDLSHMADSAAASLSGGQRKLLELGRVLMRQPQMILLDEPTAGVAPALTRSLVNHLESLRQDGMTLLIVEHDLNLIMRLVDHLVVMHLGSVLVEGPPETVRQDPRVLESYLGGVNVG